MRNGRTRGSMGGKVPAAGLKWLFLSGAFAALTACAAGAEDAPKGSGTDLGPAETGAAPMAIEADPGGDPAKGARMAEELCSRCHAVQGEPESPVADAPPFHRLRRMWPLDHMEEALAQGIMVGHPTVQMPVFQFTPREISDLLAYIDQIEPQRPDLEPEKMPEDG